jgi:hypothetical protein
MSEPMTKKQHNEIAAGINILSGAKPMGDECTCPEDMREPDCQRCQKLEKAGDEFLEYNGVLGVGHLLEDRQSLREEKEAWKTSAQMSTGPSQSDYVSLDQENAKLHKVVEAVREGSEDMTDAGWLRIRKALRELDEAEPRTINVSLKYAGRSKPIPVYDEDELDEADK